jgi:uncharacterized protein (DUF302 family)
MFNRVVASILFLFLATPVVQAADGLITLSSRHAVKQTVDRLESALTTAGFRIFARVDHGAGASSVGMALPASELLIFGKPKAGTVLMQQSPTAGIDLPLKYLVWESEDGGVTIGWNDASWLVARHGISSTLPLVAKITGALQKFAVAAAE